MCLLQTTILFFIFFFFFSRCKSVHRQLRSQASSVHHFNKKKSSLEWELTHDLMLLPVSILWIDFIVQCVSCIGWIANLINDIHHLNLTMWTKGKISQLFIIMSIMPLTPTVGALFKPNTILLHIFQLLKNCWLNNYLTEITKLKMINNSQNIFFNFIYSHLLNKSVTLTLLDHISIELTFHLAPL